MIDELRVKPGSRVKLANWKSDATLGWEKESAKEQFRKELARLDVLQSRLWAEGTRSLLLVLQAMDAAGKDGTIRSIFTGVNPAGVRVISFKAPVGAEREHDYLWRIHQQVPAKGEIGIFNRSHYEDVLVVRVKNFAPKSVWSRRYDHIRNFEQQLTDEGTAIVKVYLNISYDEQGRRLQDRIDDPEEQWKANAGDLDDRKLWPDFMAAYQDALGKTSTAQAPWYIVPADRKWVRNLAIAKILVSTLEKMRPKLPAPDPSIIGLKVDGVEPEQTPPAAG